MTLNNTRGSSSSLVISPRTTSVEAITPENPNLNIQEEEGTTLGSRFRLDELLSNYETVPDTRIPIINSSPPSIDEDCIASFNDLQDVGEIGILRSNMRAEGGNELILADHFTFTQLDLSVLGFNNTLLSLFSHSSFGDTLSQFISGSRFQNMSNAEIIEALPNFIIISVLSNATGVGNFIDSNHAASLLRMELRSIMSLRETLHANFLATGLIEARIRDQEVGLNDSVGRVDNLLEHALVSIAQPESSGATGDSNRLRSLGLVLSLGTIGGILFFGGTPEVSVTTVVQNLPTAPVESQDCRLLFYLAFKALGKNLKDFFYFRR